MKFYFCETCGKRITDEQVRDKGLKGWYCPGCATSVMTLEMDALTEESARAALEKEKARTRATTAVKSAPVASRRHSATILPPAARSTPTPSRETFSIWISAGALGVIVLVAAVVLLAGGKKSPEHSAEKPAAAASTPPDAKPVLSAPVPQPVVSTVTPPVKNSGSPAQKEPVSKGKPEEPQRLPVSVAPPPPEPAEPPPAKPAVAKPPAQTTAAEKRREDQQELRNDLLRRLKEKNPAFEDADISFQAGKIAVIKADRKNLVDLSPLKGLELKVLQAGYCKITDLSPLAGMPLEALQIPCSEVADISPLKGMPLKSCNLHGSNVADFSPLKDMPLSGLDIGFTPLKDLSVLSGLKLNYLHVENTAITTLEPLRGMPLTTLRIFNCKVIDLTPIKEMKLVSITLSSRFVQLGNNMEILKNIPTLETINHKPKAEFFQAHDKK